MAAGLTSPTECRRTCALQNVLDHLNFDSSQTDSHLPVKGTAHMILACLLATQDFCREGRIQEVCADKLVQLGMQRVTV